MTVVNALPVRTFAALLFTVGPLAILQAAKPLPYVAIDNPQFIKPADATFLSDSDRLIGISSGDVVKAYPAAILAQHGVVLDDLPKGPIAVTW
jgi:hypothetical protein